VIGGKLCAGLTEEEIDYLGREGTKVTKASRRDLPILVAKKAVLLPAKSLLALRNPLLLQNLPLQKNLLKNSFF